MGHHHDHNHAHGHAHAHGHDHAHGHGHGHGGSAGSGGASPGAESTDPAALRIQNIAMAASLSVAVLMLVGKLGAAWLTGSRAILSDALESVVHIAATAIAAFSVAYARLPADRKHPYGHGRVLFLSAGMEGVLIAVAAFAIIWLGIRDLIHGPELDHLGWGLLVTGALGGLNLLLGLWLVRVGRRTRSVAIEANGQHVLTDMWTSFAVLVGVAVVWVTDILWLDPVVAIAAGVNILWMGAKLVRRAFHGLLGTVDPAIVALIRDALTAAQAEGELTSFHQLRVRTEGNAWWAEVHMLLPGELDLASAHARATRVEARIRDAMGDRVVHLITYLEPAAGHDAVHAHDHDRSGDLTEPPPAAD